jgi:hypothetical protein
MGRFRKAMFYAGQAAFLPVVKYESDAEVATREQTALLRQQTELLRQQAQPSADSAMAFYCADCVNAGCYVGGQLRVMKNPKLCDCTAHHA